jgi:hypothetical protein
METIDEYSESWLGYAPMFDLGGTTLPGVTDSGGPYKDEQVLEAALARSREGMARALTDPEIRARILTRLAELESRPPTPTMTGDEFLARVGFGPEPSSAG